MPSWGTRLFGVNHLRAETSRSRWPPSISGLSSVKFGLKVATMCEELSYHSITLIMEKRDGPPRNLMRPEAPTKSVSLIN